MVESKLLTFMLYMHYYRGTVMKTEMKPNTFQSNFSRMTIEQYLGTTNPVPVQLYYRYAELSDANMNDTNLLGSQTTPPAPHSNL